MQVLKYSFIYVILALFTFLLCAYLLFDTFTNLQLTAQTAGYAKSSIFVVVFAALLIFAYITFIFRNIPKPYVSYKLGIIIVFALLHDMALTFSAYTISHKIIDFSAQGWLLIAILSVLVFSIIDKIVVFSLIEENLKEYRKKKLFENVNNSLNEVLKKSFVILLALLIILIGFMLAGGIEIRYFILVMGIGLISGTYSTLFIAAPLFVLLENPKKTQRKK